MYSHLQLRHACLRARHTQVFDVGLAHGPGGQAWNDKQAFAYHIYCEDFAPSIGPLCGATDAYAFRMFLGAARRLGAASFLTEWGALGSDHASLAEVASMAALADAHLASWTWWAYKWLGDFTTSDGPTESLFDEHGALQWDKIRLLARPFAPAVAGTPLGMEFDPMARTFSLYFRMRCHGPTDAHVTTVIHTAAAIQYNYTISTSANATNSHPCGGAGRNKPASGRRFHVALSPEHMATWELDPADASGSTLLVRPTTACGKEGDHQASALYVSLSPCDSLS